jgi:non-specific serine/threonine protein kinase
MATNGSDDDQTRSITNLASGTVVSHYRIFSKIGAGGMGEVYLAEDSKLSRKVALKFLPQHLCQDEDSRTRLTREAKAAAKLDHPNIVPVYEVGELQGRPFFAMAHIEGKSLREVIKEAKLSIAETTDLTKQICEGLHEAHTAGVVHRDIKPGNIIIDKNGKPRLLDFGLATLSGEDKLTATGSTLGTVGYMSPEQIEGAKVDHRSDLFSAGVILYEMLTGRRPFEGDNAAAVVKAVTDSTPEPIARFKSGVTGELQQIVDKALSKEPSLRYQHADEMLADLKRLQLDTPRPGRSRLGLWIAAAVIVIVGGYLTFESFIPDDSIDSPPERIMLAVLPFENLGDPEDEYFADGITEEIIGKLARLSGLGVISRTSSMQYEDSEKSLREIGNELGAEYILEGTVRWVHSGDQSHIRVQPQLIRVENDVHIWADSYDAVFEDVLGLQSQIALSIADALNISLLSSERAALSDARPVDPEVYDLYLRAANYKVYNFETNQAAIDDLKRAIELDPTFAPAYARLAAAMVIQFRWFGERALGAVSEARIHAERAIELDSTAADGYAALAEYLYDVEDDLGQAMYYLQLASAKEPDNAHVMGLMGEVMFMEGKFEASRQLYERALTVDPAQPQHMLATIFEWHREWQPLVAYYDKLILFYPDSVKYRVFRAQAIGNMTLSLDSMKAHLPTEIDTMVSAYSHPALWDAFIHAGAYEWADRGARDKLGRCRLAVDSAETYLFLVVVHYLMEDRQAPLIADTVITMFSRFLDNESPSSLRFDIVRTQLALTYALRGDSSIADSLCRLVLAKSPADDWSSLSTILDVCANTLSIIGEKDRAIDILEELMSRPSVVSLFTLKFNRGYDPLRNHPRFQALIEKYEKEHGI